MKTQNISFKFYSICLALIIIVVCFFLFGNFFNNKAIVSLNNEIQKKANFVSEQAPAALSGKWDLIKK